MTEWLDIVDETDSVIGRAPRDQIHREGHRHRSTHIVLFNSRGQIFVQLRSRFKDVAAGLWDTSAAGHVDSGESYEACAVRELHEELGVRVSIDQLRSVGRLRPEQRNGFEFTQVYAVCSDQSLVLQEEEVEDGRWLSVDELGAWIEQSPADFTQVFRVIYPMIMHVEGDS